MTETRRLFITLALAAAAAAGLAFVAKDALVSPAPSPPAAAAPPPQAARVPAGPLVVLARDGGRRDLASPTGKGLILHFWATWCGPCREEMPALATFVKETKSDPNVEFLSVSVDEEWKVVDAWLKERGLSDLPVLLDPKGPVSARYGIDGYPETLFIAPSGEIVQHFVGMVDWGKPRTRQFAAEFSRASASTALAR
jgi:thiol-disulfide isomerase/thioredoxin